MNGEPTRGAKRQARNLQWSVSGLCLWARAMSRHSSNASHIVLCSAKIVLKGPYLGAIRDRLLNLPFLGRAFGEFRENPCTHTK